jgi:hypothetical protein
VPTSSTSIGFKTFDSNIRSPFNELTHLWLGTLKSLAYLVKPARLRTTSVIESASFNVLAAPRMSLDLARQNDRMALSAHGQRVPKQMLRMHAYNAVPFYCTVIYIDSYNVKRIKDA